MIQTLAGKPNGKNELTSQNDLPSLDLLRTDLLKGTGAWRRSDPMDGSQQVEPVASMMRLLDQARTKGLDVYIFGRFYTEGKGIHDTHLNQGSTGPDFEHKQGNDNNDHNDIWQDGALFVAVEPDKWAAYFAAFENQYVPTNDLGNPTPDAKPVEQGGV